MQFGLKKIEIEKINSVFASFPEVEEVVLYGSRAKGINKLSSDIDLTLKGKNLDYPLFCKIALELDDLLLTYKIDLSLFRLINNADLIEHINRRGVLFYRNEGTLLS